MLQPIMEKIGGAGTDGSSMYAVDGGGWLGRVFNS